MDEPAAEQATEQFSKDQGAPSGGVVAAVVDTAPFPASSSTVPPPFPITRATTPTAELERMRTALLVASRFEGQLLVTKIITKNVQQSMEEAYKLGDAFENLQEENAKMKAAHSELEKKHKALEEDRARDAAATQEAFNAKLKELKLAKTKSDKLLTQAQSDLEKVTRLREEDKKVDDTLARAVAEMKKGDEFSIKQFEDLGDVLSADDGNSDTENQRVDAFVRALGDFALVKLPFVKSLGRLHVRAQVAQRFAIEAREATQNLKSCLLLEYHSLMDINSMVPCLRDAPTQVARWRSSSARSGAKYALALTKTYFPGKIHNLERVGFGDLALEIRTTNTSSAMQTPRVGSPNSPTLLH